MRTVNGLTRPFLKWPGGKFRLVPTLLSLMPERTHLVEPFAGAGALLLNAPHPKITLNDINPDLINLFQQCYLPGFIMEAKAYFSGRFNRDKRYYQLRQQFNQSDDPLERALLFLYLNRHGYNGLCRYNLKGHYNVPFGAYKKPYFPQDELESFISRKQKPHLSAKHYRVLLKAFLKRKHLEHTVFYCDPPYAPLSETANFTGYSANKFTLDDQEELATLAKALAKKGAFVLISNHDTPFTRRIYKGATFHPLSVARTISCNTHKRQKVAEIIACFSL